MRRENQTVPTGFVFIGFSYFPKLQAVLFVLFLLMHVVTLVGNILIMFVIRLNQQLHMPMYFFLSALSFSEICYTFSIIPKMLSGLVLGTRTISFLGCAAQMHFSFIIWIHALFSPDSDGI